MSAAFQKSPQCNVLCLPCQWLPPFCTELKEYVDKQACQSARLGVDSLSSSFFKVVSRHDRLRDKVLNQDLNQARGAARDLAHSRHARLTTSAYRLCEQGLLFVAGWLQADQGQAVLLTAGW